MAGIKATSKPKRLTPKPEVLQYADHPPERAVYDFGSPQVTLT